DIGDPNQAGRWFLFQDLNDWMRYFNRHYQTYHRLVHFWAYLDDETNNLGPSGPTYNPTFSGADASQNWNDKHPFASFDEAGIYQTTYAGFMAQHRTLNFGGQAAIKSQSAFENYPGFFWSFG